MLVLLSVFARDCFFRDFHYSQKNIFQQNVFYRGNIFFLIKKRLIPGKK